MSRSMDVGGGGFVTPGQTLSRTALQIGTAPTPSTVVPAHRRAADNMNATTKEG